MKPTKAEREIITRIMLAEKRSSTTRVSKRKLQRFKTFLFVLGAFAAAIGIACLFALIANYLGS